MFYLLLTTWTGRLICGGIILSALLLGGFQVKGCMEARRELKLYKAVEKARQKAEKHDSQVDQKTQNKIDNLRKKIESETPEQGAQDVNDELNKYFQWGTGEGKKR